jgi:hypothetical protein
MTHTSLNLLHAPALKLAFVSEDIEELQAIN